MCIGLYDHKFLKLTSLQPIESVTRVIALKRQVVRHFDGSAFY